VKDQTAEYIAAEEATTRLPSELYHFWREVGDEHWRYTNGDVAVLYGGNTYTPATLQRDTVKFDANLEVARLSIQAGYVEDPLLQYIGINPVEVIWVEVLAFHRDQDPIETSSVFIGQVRQVSFEGVKANIECVSFEYFLRMPIPVNRYQVNCNWKLFDSHCKLVKADYKITATVTVDSTKTLLTSATFAGQDNGYFTGGFVEFSGQTRTVVRHIGNTLTLAYRLSDIETGMDVDAYPGDDGRIETCRDKFNNILNFFGFPFNPVDNPSIRT
jgi:uncharacterized phage protein (TIGR02218 family)